MACTRGSRGAASGTTPTCGVSFVDLSGHALEVITVPYGGWDA
ncbi:hypothetical protein [Streptomyces sp. CA-253872]